MPSNSDSGKLLNYAIDLQHNFFFSILSAWTPRRRGRGSNLASSVFLKVPLRFYCTGVPSEGGSVDVLSFSCIGGAVTAEGCAVIVLVKFHQTKLRNGLGKWESVKFRQPVPRGGLMREDNPAIWSSGSHCFFFLVQSLCFYMVIIRVNITLCSVPERDFIKSTIATN